MPKAYIGQMGIIIIDNKQQVQSDPGASKLNLLCSWPLADHSQYGPRFKWNLVLEEPQHCQEAQIDIPKSVHSVQVKFLECSKLLGGNLLNPSTRAPTWSPLTLGSVKINVDVA